MNDGQRYWRLSSFYLFYFALLGGIVPFWGLYLQSLGHDEAVIGTLLAVLMGTRIVAPNLWGWLADRTGRRIRIIRIGTLLTLVSFSWAFWARSFWELVLLMLAFSFFWNAVLPQFEVVTLRALGANRSRYSRVRVWGSVGFILAVVGLGVLFDHIDIAYLVPVLFGLMLLIWLSALLVGRDEEAVSAPAKGELLSVLKRPEVLAFLAVALLIQLGHGPYYGFYSIYMVEHGYGRTEIGLLWALGVVAEVVLFIGMHRLLHWTGLRRMVLYGMAICTLRWGLIAGYPESLVVMLFAQLLHAVTFGCLHAVSIALVHRFFPESSQGQGQALYSSCGFGVGGALGAWAGGAIWHAFGGSAIFWFAALVSLLGWGVAFVWLVGVDQQQSIDPEHADAVQ